MNNDWSNHVLKAAERAQRAAMLYKKAAGQNDSGDVGEALHFAYLAAVEMEYSTQHAIEADECCKSTMIYDTLDY